MEIPRILCNDVQGGEKDFGGEGLPRPPMSHPLRAVSFSASSLSYLHLGDWTTRESRKWTICYTSTEEVTRGKLSGSSIQTSKSAKTNG